MVWTARGDPPRLSAAPLEHSFSTRTGAANALRAMRGSVDGLLVMASALPASMLDQALHGSLPILLLNNQMDNHPSIRINNALGAEIVVPPLVADGARRIAHISRPGRKHRRAREKRAIRAALAAMRPG